MDMDIDSLPHAPPSVEDIIKLAEALAVGEGPKVPVDEWTHDDDLLIAQ
jgi:hypothetical protein